MEKSNLQTLKTITRGYAQHETIQRPSKNLFGQINDAHEYSIFANKKIKDSTLVHTAEIKVLKAGVFATECKDWRSLDEGDRNWEQFQLW